MPFVKKIIVYPVKSLDGVKVSSVAITSGGSLQCDREFALFDDKGRTINGKKYPAIQQIRSVFDLENRTVTLQSGPDKATFHLDDERPQLNDWFSDYFHLQTELRQNRQNGFPDDTEVPGPTIISEETLAEIQSWFPENDLDNIRRRFRANIELGDCGMPFWEDRLYGEPGSYVPFQIGEVNFKGSHPCSRCVVPSRNPFTAEGDRSFQKKFMEWREANLPAFAHRERFDHFYRLAVNTLVDAAEAGKNIGLDDRLNYQTR